MQTVEYDKNGAVVTALCTKGKNGDVEVQLNNDGSIIIMQHDLEEGFTEVIQMTADHFVDLFNCFEDIEKIRQLGKVTK
jgi:hypothetical protein